jgi:hypothetical protein
MTSPWRSWLLSLIALSIFIVCLVWAIAQPSFESIAAALTAAAALLGALVTHDFKKDWDIFICYASEDKEFARELATALKGKDLRVWFDEFTVKVGDPLQDSIGGGLAKSEYGVVILSEKFLRKPWPVKELTELLDREKQVRKNLVLPVLHNTDINKAKKDLAKYRLAALGDRHIISSSIGLDQLVAKLVDAIGITPARSGIVQKIRNLLKRRMERRLAVLLLVLSTLVVLLRGSEAIFSVLNPSVSASPTAAEAATSTLNPAFSPSLTLTPSSTSTATHTDSPTPTSTSSSTSTPTPSLTPERTRARTPSPTHDTSTPTPTPSEVPTGTGGAIGCTPEDPNCP